MLISPFSLIPPRSPISQTLLYTRILDVQYNNCTRGPYIHSGNILTQISLWAVANNSFGKSINFEDSGPDSCKPPDIRPR